MYTSENFLRAAKEFTHADIRDDLIAEVRERLASQRETQRATESKFEVPIPEAEKSISPSTPEKASDLKASPLDSQQPKSEGE